MFSESLSLFLLLLSFTTTHAIQWSGSSFTYNGFKNSATDLIQGGLATVTGNGLLRLTDLTQRQQGHAFYAKPLVFKNSSNGETFSFSTTFVLAIFPKHSDIGGQGMAFVISPSTTLQGSQPNQYLGLLNKTNNGNSSNHILAVEFDTFINSDLFDINENHIGIDINSLRSNVSSPVKYNLNGVDKNFSLISGDRLQVWIDYNGLDKRLSVAIAPISLPKPKLPLLLLNLDISFVLLDSMYVGFSAATGTSMQSSHYILGWSFKIDGEAQPLDLSRLPRLPRQGSKGVSKIVTIVLPLILPVLAVVVIASSFLLIRRMKMYEEVYEDWERKYGPHRFLYKDLYVATKGFREKGLLGMGGFGSVYKGVLPTSKMEVAVKRISHESKQGIKEFVAEIVSIGQLRHRNIVQLLGYCRRKHELFLVYDYMPNGSLDKYLHCGFTSLRLDWKQRFQIIKGVASGLVYLHEEWEQVVIHRDIKASNVLLDADFNGRLGDFGLARLYDHGTNPQTTHVVGTLGYIAPEMTRSGKATTSTDVYGFGAFLLEVACGRRPIEPLASHGNIILSDWVVSCWSKGEILEVSDPNLGSEYVKEEMELVLKLGLLCSQTKTTARPSMRQVLQFLDKDLALPELSLHGLTVESIGFGDGEGFSDFAVSYPSLEMATTTTFTSVADRVLSP